MNESGAPVENIAQLYEAARRALPLFHDALLQLLGGEPGAVAFTVAALKGVVRAGEKARDDYGGRKDADDGSEVGPPEAWLFDIVRASVLCRSTQQLLRVMELVQGPGTDFWEVVRVKNRFASPTPSGFRDCNLSLRLRVGCTPAGAPLWHMCELQVHHERIKHMDVVVESHALYEFFRSYFRGNSQSVRERMQMLEAALGEGGERGKGVGQRGGQLGGAAFADRAIAQAREQVQQRGDAGDGFDVGALRRAAELLECLGERSAALQARQALLELTEAALGRDHRDTLASCNNLACLLRAMGERTRALALYERALEARERVLGRNHPETLASVNGLACLLNNMGERTRALALHERALEARERVLGATTRKR